MISCILCQTSTSLSNINVKREVKRQMLTINANARRQRQTPTLNANVTRNVKH